MAEKELLLQLIEQNKDIRSENKDLAKNFYQLAEDFSNFKNGQERHNDKILYYLQDDPMTGHEGVVTTTKKTSDRMDAIEKIVDKKTALGAIVLSAIIWGGKFLFSKLTLLA